MPAYTVMFMRRDATDRRPLTLHISSFIFWGVISLAIVLPIIGFLVSAGLIAPAWLQLNFDQMQQQVATANQIVDPLKQQNATLTAEKQRLSQTLQAERSKRAEIEARVTMAETARVEATTRLTELEAEVINLKRAQAEYEQLLKPKMAKNLLECSNIDLTYANNQLSYELAFTKIAKVRLPATLAVEVTVRSGNNAVALAGPAAATAQHTLAMAKSQRITGRLLAANLPADTTRMAQVWVRDGNTPVGYCWKSF